MIVKKSIGEIISVLAVFRETFQETKCFYQFLLWKNRTRVHITDAKMYHALMYVTNSYSEI